MFRAPPLRRTLPAALRDANAESAATRVSALHDLTMHAEDSRGEVVSALERALSDRAPTVRAAAAIALADISGVEALPALLFAVEDEDPHARQMAITALGEIGDRRAGERLRRALTDERPEVRFQAVIAFGRVVPDEADDAILRALDDTDPSIRYVAIRCAEEGTERADAAMSPRLFVKIAALAGDDDPATRVAAAIVLARGGDPRGGPLLLDVVSGRVKTPEAEDEAAVIDLCGELALDEARPHLERRAFGRWGRGDDRFAWQALVALARMGDSRARTRIVRDLGSWWRDRRTLAVAAAGRARLVEARQLILSMRGDAERADADAVAETLAQLGDADVAAAPSREVAS